MKFVLKSFAALALLALPWLGYCAPPPVATEKPNIDASVRAALAISQSGQRRPEPAPAPVQPKAGCPCGCSCGADCACASGQPCGDPACSCIQVAAKKPLPLNDAIDKAVLTNKPLCIWVAEVCPPCEKKMPGYIHTHVKQYERYSGEIVKNPCVIVGHPFHDVVVMRGIIWGCPEDIAEQVSRLLNPPVSLPQPPIPQPQFFAPPPPMFFGGFGSGCRS